MSLAQLTSALAVKSAIEECDRLGDDEFLGIYGFGPARKYLLLYEGRKYDPKAIAGVAHKYEFPGLGPLTSDMFSGGITKDGAARRLRALGFRIEEITANSGPAKLSSLTD